MGVILYILLSGYPPFYPKHGPHNRLSDGMRKRIKAGKYKFDRPEWKEVSEEAKSIIKRMLIVDPAQRITIGEIKNCSWLKELISERPIDMSSIEDEENRNQIEVR